ncbi:formyltetrahydrofolate deformylase [Brachybacterium saurashtrense]|uniref:Formyltetrahydrofolate deformylase n=1 Tax=Brachybacterium saurashtrense TaxID=556288 RepID=A0A345YMB9_9MICO|nr:formyltetrahydrofolate deformylase [Brachybacterium saurashtrense]AXK45071.1 formyltetrahydrofolate deformylase [Brachybacterium saurashtrense]RRR21755.1 formyltetrahydrofolate deformylase [Brachybacterium saurashtrense]
MSSATPTSPSPAETHEYVLTVVCADAPGIVHAVTGAIVEVGGNITESRQFESGTTQRFYLRLQVRTPASATELEAALAPAVERFGLEHRIDEVGRPVRTLLLGSTATHCVNDLLFQVESGHLPVQVPLILANHPTLERLAGFHGVPFEHLPTTGPGGKAAFEDRVRQAVAEHDIELVVLARYMQILSPELCEELAGRCINIHHSFLPGFKGANPYRQAHARGVKQIGATAHFVTSDLDEGPIIEQEVLRVDHTRSPQELMAIGQDVEARTLRQAVAWFAQSRVLLDGARTVVFR